MKKQVSCSISLPAWQSANVYNDGFVIKVTRQISEALYENLKSRTLPEGYEVFIWKGRRYLSWHKFYYNDDGYYLFDPEVQATALRAHKSIMHKILSYKRDEINIRIESYI